MLITNIHMFIPITNTNSFSSTTFRGIVQSPRRKRLNKTALRKDCGRKYDVFIGNQMNTNKMKMITKNCCHILIRNRFVLLIIKGVTEQYVVLVYRADEGKQIENTGSWVLSREMNKKQRLWIHVMLDCDEIYFKKFRDRN
eukprot:291865_1